MENLLTELKKYFKETSPEQIKADWDKSKECDNVNSPTIDSFLRMQIVGTIEKLEEEAYKEFIGSNEAQLHFKESIVDYIIKLMTVKTI